ncbi:MAG: NAD(P) transhydrogenase subunit alpha [Janthinobacterium lividum]
MTIFILACFVGYYVVWKVTPALHTPLMALTNAISGIIIIGSMLASSPTDFGLSSLLGYLATFLAAINIFGGFVVTERMLGMFKKK